MMRKLLDGVVAIVAVLAVGVVSSAMANSLTVYNYNGTNQTWNGKDCIVTAHPSPNPSCRFFTLGNSPVMETLVLPSSGTASLGGYFVDISTNAPPVQCSKSFDVHNSTAASIYVYQASSGTYACQVTLP